MSQVQGVPELDYSPPLFTAPTNDTFRMYNMNDILELKCNPLLEDAAIPASNISGEIDFKESPDQLPGNMNLNENPDSTTETSENKSNEAILDSVHKTVKDIDDFQEMLSSRMASFEDKIQQLEKIADNLDSFHKGAVVARIAGNSVSAAGGITALTGLMLAPFTFGVSAVVASVGVGISVLGGAASATSFIADSSTQKENCKKVKEIIVSYFEEADDIYKCLTSLGEEFEKIEKMDERFSSKYVHMKNSKAEDGDPSMSVDELAAILGLAGVARASLVTFHAMSKLARAFTGVLSGLFLALDAYLLVKDARELSEGTPNETTDHIRNVSVALKESLKDLNDYSTNIIQDRKTLRLLFKISQKEENSELQKNITTDLKEAT